jgi:hypothetical protein
MVEAKPKSYKERMRAARAAARAKRQAEKAEWLRQVTLVAEVRRLSLEAVKATIRDRGDKSRSTPMPSFVPRLTP